MTITYNNNGHEPTFEEISSWGSGDIRPAVCKASSSRRRSWTEGRFHPVNPGSPRYLAGISLVSCLTVEFLVDYDDNGQNFWVLCFHFQPFEKPLHGKNEVLMASQASQASQAQPFFTMIFRYLGHLLGTCKSIWLAYGYNRGPPNVLSWSITASNYAYLPTINPNVKL